MTYLVLDRRSVVRRAEHAATASSAGAQPSILPNIFALLQF